MRSDAELLNLFLGKQTGKRRAGATLTALAAVYRLFACRLDFDQDMNSAANADPSCERTRPLFCTISTNLENSAGV
jgi:hypothetical protein